MAKPPMQSDQSKRSPDSRKTPQDNIRQSKQQKAAANLWDALRLPSVAELEMCHGNCDRWIYKESQLDCVIRKPHQE